MTSLISDSLNMLNKCVKKSLKLNVPDEQQEEKTSLIVHGDNNKFMRRKHRKSAALGEDRITALSVLLTFYYAIM